MAPPSGPVTTQVFLFAPQATEPEGNCVDIGNIILPSVARQSVGR